MRGISTFLSFNASLLQRCQRHKSTTRPTVLLQNRQATPTPKGTGRNGRPGPLARPTDQPPQGRRAHRADTLRSQAVGGLNKNCSVLVGVGRVP